MRIEELEEKENLWSRQTRAELIASSDLRNVRNSILHSFFLLQRNCCFFSIHHAISLLLSPSLSIHPSNHCFFSLSLFISFHLSFVWIHPLQMDANDIFVDFMCGIREKKRLASYTHERIDRSELPCFYLNELTTLPLCDFVSLRRWKRKTFIKKKKKMKKMREKEKEKKKWKTD